MSNYQIPLQSKTSLRSCLVIHSLIYWIILSFGNVVTTLLASLVIVQLSPSLNDYYFVLAPFFGVFGFETILKNTNVTMFDKGVLTIQDWIERALNAAAAAAIEEQEIIKNTEEQNILTTLDANSEEQINTLILNKLGGGVVDKLEADAKASHSSAKQYKILQYIRALNRTEISAILRSK